MRLGSFLVMRVMKTGHDSRFDQAKNEPGTFFVYWTMQVRQGPAAEQLQGYLAIQGDYMRLK
jgi:hypothetical protein